MTSEIIEHRREYLDALERRIEELAARVEALEAHAADADPVVKADLEEGIDELHSRLDDTRERHARLLEAQDEAWPHERTACDQAWTDVEDAYRDLHRTLAGR
jgi:hypothetical protein